MENNWYFAISGKQHGPVTEGDLKRHIQDGEVQPDDLIWRKGMSDWQKLKDTKLYDCAENSQHDCPTARLKTREASSRTLLIKILLSVSFFIALAFLALYGLFDGTRSDIANSKTIDLAFSEDVLESDKLLQEFEGKIPSYTEFRSHILEVCENQVYPELEKLWFHELNYTFLKEREVRQQVVPSSLERLESLIDDSISLAELLKEPESVHLKQPLLPGVEVQVKLKQCLNRQQQLVKDLDELILREKKEQGLLSKTLLQIEKEKQELEKKS